MRASLLSIAAAALLAGCPMSHRLDGCSSTDDCPAGLVCRAGVCADLTVCRPTGAEICGNGFDENCNGMADDTCSAGSVTRTYVISTMDVLPPVDLSQAHGFDLDFMDGGTAGLPCTAALDFTSRATGVTGVDNQLGQMFTILDGMLSPGLNGAVRDEIQRGDLLWILEVSDIDSFANDASVNVRVVLGRVPSGSMPSTSGAGLAPGQAFAAVAELGTASGTITGGRLRAASGTLTFPLGFRVMDVFSALPIRGGVIGGRISETGGLTQGEIGGTVLVDDVLAFFAGFIDGVDIATIEALLMPDIQPDATGAHCGSVSSGIAFEAVPATLE